LLEDEQAKLITMGILKSSKSEELVANKMRVQKIQLVKVQTKEREKRRSGKITNKGILKNHL
jgi:hypothetical protein